MQIVLASRNAHKVVEVSRILSTAGVDVDLVGMDEVGVEIPEIVETGATFAENASLKAETVARAVGLPALADDSGLSVAALNGMPGVLSARWAGSHGDDRANRELVLDQCADVAPERRQAAFVCVVALAVPGQPTTTAEGRVEGMLTMQPQGTGGFGYDPIFVPSGSTRTTAQLSPTEKDALSHRGKALRLIAPALTQLR
jgi:XTP/dITP diphosphohydrolase